VNPSASSPADQLRDIAKPVHYIGAFDLTWFCAALAVFLVGAGLIWWFYFRKKPRRPPVLPLLPRQLAARRLQELLSRMHEMDARAFGNEACDILRQYVGAQYGLHPERQTSPEFLESIGHSRAFSPHEHSLLRDFLDGCDLLKFARHDAAPEAKERLVQEASEFIAGGELPRAVPPPLPAGAR